MRGIFELRQAIFVSALVAAVLGYRPSHGEEHPFVDYDVSTWGMASNEEAWKLMPPSTKGAGSPLPSWARALARTLPHTTAAMLSLDMQYRTTDQFTPRERGLARLGAAAANRSGYGRAYALAELTPTGLDETTVNAIAGGDLSALSVDEQKLFRFAEQLSRAGRDLTDEQVAEMNALLGEDRLVAFVLLIAYANMQDRLVHAFRIPVEEGGPLAPLETAFEHPSPEEVMKTRVDRGGAPSQEKAEAQLTREAAEGKSPVDWSDFTFQTIQERLAEQRAKPGRIAIPTWEEMVARFPEGFYDRDRPLKIVWTRLVAGRQPKLGTAWLTCLQVFAVESMQNRQFEELMFWVVTRELRCFYCMGHCEMLLEAARLRPVDISVRTRVLSKGDWKSFPAPQRIAFALAAKMTREPWSVNEEEISVLTETFGQARAADILWWIARCQFMTKISDAFQLPLESENVFAR